MLEPQQALANVQSFFVLSSVPDQYGTRDAGMRGEVPSRFFSLVSYVIERSLLRFIFMFLLRFTLCKHCVCLHVVCVFCVINVCV